MSRTGKLNDSDSAIEAAENDRSRGQGALPRLEPESTRTGASTSRTATALTRQFREVAERLVAPGPDPKPRTRRRSGDDKGGSFRFSAMNILRRSDKGRTVASRLPRELWVRATDDIVRDRIPAVTRRDEPAGVGEIIAWYLANGFTMAQIRFRFPEFFASEAYSVSRQSHAPVQGYPTEFHEPELWQWNTIPDDASTFDDIHCAGHNDFHPHL